ncbi:MAG: hypothetical protein RL150_557 [Candidatus Parcubacteria bacterium]|jgi:branched-chain amino acid transport system substrate-binding protein
MSNSKKWITALVGVVVLVVFAVFQKSGPSETGPIKVGFIGPLTGDVAPIGESLRNAVSIAVDEINARGGRQLEVVYEDGACSGTAAASAAQKLITIDGVKFIIGGMCSGETLGAAPIAEAAGVIMLSPLSSSPDITTAGDYIFRVFASDATSGNIIAETAADRGYLRIAVLAEQTDYAQALKRVFEQRYAELGGTIIVNENYATSDKDFRSKLTKIKEANPDALYIIPQSPQSAEVLLGQIKSMDIDTQLFSNELATTESVRAAGLVEGVLFAEVSFDKASAAAQAFNDSYEKAYGEVNASTPLLYAASAYDATVLLYEIITDVGSDANKVKDALYDVTGWEGATGTLTLDENGDAVRAYTLKQVVNGEIVEVK